jgi:light-regulated signal transduction histidine kinase (bacteriophytochrome)
MSIATRCPLELECRLIPSGRTDLKWHLARAIFIAGESGGVGKWFGTLTDIEAQKRIEAELRRVNDDLRQFAYAASHDLQEPLRMINLYTEMLLKALAPDIAGETAEYEHFIRDGVRRMRDLLEDLLAYTAIGGEKDQPKGRVDTAAVLKTVLSNLYPAIEEAGAVIEIGELPTLQGQEVHFIQLFQNLVGNALKYRSKETPRIEVGAQRVGAMWRFHIKDNGIGIAPEFRERIFGVFKRLHGKDIPGTGIGLAICNRVVDRYGGRIWVEQNGERGSVFLFEIPAQRPRQGELAL